MKIILTGLLFVPLAAGFAAELPTEHTVQPKDTLWDLAGQYYHDHFKWRQIADANPAPKIRDPHWIYPNQILRIPTLEETPVAVPEKSPVEPAAIAAAPALAPTAAPKAAPKAPERKRRPATVGEPDGTVGDEGISEDFAEGDQEMIVGAYPFAGRFKAKPGWAVEGSVLENARDGERMAQVGDLVEVRVDVKGEVKPGDEFSVYRRAAAVDTEPDPKALYLMRVAHVSIQGPSGKPGVYKAEITQMNDAVQSGDWIRRGD